MKITEEEVTTTRKVLHLDGNEFNAAIFLDTLEEIERTDMWGHYLIPDSPREEKVFDYLHSNEVVGRRVGGGYFCKDEVARKELLDELLEVYYNE